MKKAVAKAAQPGSVMTDDERRKLVSTQSSLSMPDEPPRSWRSTKTRSGRTSRAIPIASAAVAALPSDFGWS
mgnify:CR=1 FL=1